MKKLIISLFVSTTLCGCFFDIGFDKDQHRINVPVLVSNLKDTLNIGDTLIFSAAINNPIEVVDLSKDRKKTFHTTFPGNARLEIVLALYEPLVDRNYQDVIKPDKTADFYDFFPNSGVIKVIPYPAIVFDYSRDKFIFRFGMVIKRKGLYGIHLQKDLVNISNQNYSFTGHLWPYFSNANLNHHLLTEKQKESLQGDKRVFFYVR